MRWCKKLKPIQRILLGPFSSSCSALPRPKFHHSSPFEYLTADTLLEVVSKRWRKQSTLVTNYLFDSDEEGLAAVISRMGPFIALRDLEDSRDFEAVRCNST